MGYVGGATAYPSSTLTYTVTAGGNVLVVGCSWNDNTSDPSISDTAGHIWVPRPHVLAGSVSTGAKTFYTLNSIAGATTITISGALPDQGLSVVEYSNLSSFDVGEGRNDVNANPASGTGVTTNQADELLVGYFASESDVTDPTATGWTLRQSDVGHAHWMYEKIVSSIGSYSFSVTRGADIAACLILMTFKVSTGGAAPSIDSDLTFHRGTYTPPIMGGGLY